MTQKHTKEPLKIAIVYNQDYDLIVQGEKLIIGTVQKESGIAARIVACVNACAGLTSDQIAGLPKIIDEGTLAISERNELLEVTKKLVHAVKFRTAIGGDLVHEIVEVDKVLSKINRKGGRP